MRRALLCLVVLACKSDGHTFTLRSEVDPQHPLTVKITAKVPDGWPAPRLNDKYGWPSFSFDGGTDVRITLDQVRGATAKARVEQFDRDQLYRDGVERSDEPNGRRWVVDRDAKGTWATLIIPGPADSLVLCGISAVQDEALLKRMRDLCDSIAL